VEGKRVAFDCCPALVVLEPLRPLRRFRDVVMVGGLVRKVESELDLDRIDSRVEVPLEVLEPVEEFVAPARPLCVEPRIELGRRLLVRGRCGSHRERIPVRP
jgi:hypothetical protein